MLPQHTKLSDDHRCAVSQLLDLDPLCDEAARLRVKIADMERRDPTLLIDRVVMFADHALKVGEVPPAERSTNRTILT